MTNTSHKSYDIVVVGAGLIGASLAALLATRSSHRIALVERAPQQTENQYPNQRVVALGKVATDILRELGVFEQLGAAFCHPYKRMHVWDENSNGELTFDASDHGQEILGHMIDSSQTSLHVQTYLESTPQVDTFYASEAESLNHHGDKAFLTIKTNNNDLLTLETGLVIAADGGHSWVRQQAKIFANKRQYHQRGIIAKICSELPHNDTAWQCFLNTGPVAVLPIAGNEDGSNQGSIVWSANNERADELMSLDNDAFTTELGQALQGQLGEISLLSIRQVFPLHSQQAERYYTRHVVLVGDAAHSIHPLAGQGANLGFKDIQALAGLLCTTDSADLGELSLLENYQSLRRKDNLQTDRMMSALHAAYQNNSPWWMFARGAGMNWLSSSESLKKLLAKQAIGL